MVVKKRAVDNAFIKLVLLLVVTVWAIHHGVSRTAGSPAQAVRKIDFNREIRPILSDNCWSCHGPDAASKQAGKTGLRLDSAQASQADLGGGRRAIVPGDPQKSELYRRITSVDDAVRMPPVWAGGHRLSAREIELLTRWIEQGAEWDRHWAFIAPVKSPLPGVEDVAWPRNEIDHFVLNRLDREGLKPQAEADKATLIRRVTLDLTGLPPTPDEIDKFINDRSPDAYEKVVDRLMVSPRYGERMAFKWLDAARYADTNGYQIDGDRSAWRWRDWVIDAFNSNKPYDRFVIEQLAGDLLPNATPDQVIATAFNRNHRINAEGGIVPEEYAVEYVVDRVDTTSTVFMGLTIGCARCHNHKFDPFTHKEYYQLFAYFNSIPEDGRAFDWGNSAPWIAAPTRAQRLELERLTNRIAATERKLKSALPTLRLQQRRWEKSLAKSEDRQWFPKEKLLIHLPFGRDTQPAFQQSDKSWHNPQIRKTEDKKAELTPDAPDFRNGEPAFVHSPLGGEAVKFDRNLFFDAGRRADLRYKSTSTDFRERFAISAWVFPATDNAGAILTKMADKVEERDNGLPRIGGIGLFFVNGKFHFQMVREWNYDGYRSETEKRFQPEKWHHVLLLFDGFNQYDDRVRLFVDGKPEPLNVNQSNLYLYWGLPDRPLLIGAGGGPEMRFKGAIDDLRVYSRIPDEDEIAILSCADALSRIAAIPVAKRSRGQRMKIHRAWLDDGAPENIRNLSDQLYALRNEKQALEDSFTTLMIMRELSKPRQAHVLNRGSYDAPGEPVERGVPVVLNPLRKSGQHIDAGSNRLDFARWLVDPAHPLTSRVAVNRFWQTLFGIGLVKTVDDFGSQGELPSHPELLDYLAVDFRLSRWNVKAIIKKMVMSATYRQSSQSSKSNIQRDPENRLLARGPRLRLSAEMIRDQALAVSGLLVEKVGGPSVKPYQPDGIYKDMAFSGLTGYAQEKGDGLWRRSLYTFWKRTVLAPNMQVFDASAREFCTVRETRTNTPLQSLNLMNDVTYIEAARFLAERIFREGGSSHETRLSRAFRLATGRQPTGRELRVLIRNFEAQKKYFQSNPPEIDRFLATGEKRNDMSIDRLELAAFAATASMILNLDEVITKQ